MKNPSISEVHRTDADSANPSQRLLTFSSGGWVLLIAFLLTCLSALLVLKPVFDTGFHQAIGDGHNPDTYGFDLSNLSIPRDQLIASGKPKDAVRAVPAALVETLTVPEVDLMNQHEYVPFLLPSDKVIALTINNESRAYPLRLLNVHEIVNDTLGGVTGTPIAITWSPLCGSAAVFQRPDAQTEFGVSGLLYNSNLILFDRRQDSKQESLWPQLSFHAIAGPSLKKSLTLLPFELTTWKDWSTRHPDTQVFRGLRTLAHDYNDAQDPYNLYLNNDDLKFPVTPLPPFHTLALKTPIILTTTDMLHWKATLSSTPPAATQPNESKLYSFLFAWYAQHPSDTDYSTLTK
jgi:hypothetical protein